MKIIKITIPTSFKEIKIMYNTIILTRNAHNRNVVNKFYNDCCNEIKSDYWSKHISETMVKILTHNNGIFNKFFNEAIQNLK